MVSRVDTRLSHKNQPKLWLPLRTAPMTQLIIAVLATTAAGAVKRVTPCSCHRERKSEASASSKMKSRVAALN